MWLWCAAGAAAGAFGQALWPGYLQHTAVAGADVGPTVDCPINDANGKVQLQDLVLAMSCNQSAPARSGASFKEYSSTLPEGLQHASTAAALYIFLSAKQGRPCRFVRPEFVGSDEEPQLHISAGRHPVLDALLDEPVVPNDTHLAGQAGPRAIIITGPNMGGKSCYIRQAALIALMAQVCKPLCPR